MSSNNGVRNTHRVGACVDRRTVAVNATVSLVVNLAWVCLLATFGYVLAGHVAVLAVVTGAVLVVCGRWWAELAFGARPLLRADRSGRRPSLGRMLTHPVWTAADWTLWAARGAVAVVGWLDWEHRRAAAVLGCLAVVVLLAARRVLVDYRPGCGRCRDRGYVVHRCRPDCAGCTRGIDPCADCRRPVPAEPVLFGGARRVRRQMGASR